MILGISNGGQLLTNASHYLMKYEIDRPMGLGEVCRGTDTRTNLQRGVLSYHIKDKMNAIIKNYLTSNFEAIHC